MSAVCVLTPVVIGSWPAIATAVAGVAATMGFTVASTESSVHGTSRGDTRTRVETELTQSEVLNEVAPGQQIRIEREGVRIDFGRDERGRCTICVSGEGHSKAALRGIGDEVAGRVVQQFAYHKLMTELKERRFEIVNEKVTEDEAIRVRVRLNR